MDVDDYNIYTFLLVIDNLYHSITDISLKAKIHHVLNVFEWVPAAHTVPDYVMDWIVNFEYNRQNALCHMLYQVFDSNAKSTMKYALALWLMEQYYSNPSSVFMRLTPQDIIQRISNLYGVTIPRDFPFWSLINRP